MKPVLVLGIIVAAILSATSLATAGPVGAPVYVCTSSPFPSVCPTNAICEPDKEEIICRLMVYACARGDPSEPMKEAKCFWRPVRTTIHANSCVRSHQYVQIDAQV